MYKVLILGGGGREHALAWKIGQSRLCQQIFVAPGNAGTDIIAENLDLNPMDFDQIKETVDRLEIDYLIVGPEAPLVAGIQDYFSDHTVKVIGPSKVAAQLEGSKAFAKQFMRSFNIPTAGYIEVTKDNLAEGFAHIAKVKGQIVLKADGLAAGKGVIILDSKKKAKKVLKEMIDGKFGAASSTVVIEDFLDGVEFSVFVLTDGKSYKLLPIAKDYKRIGEGDEGLNTGGMGAISPVGFVDDKMMNQVKEDIIEPTIEGLQILEYDYKGVIFFGLIAVKGKPYVIEYNCRLGDPETEVILPRLDSNLMALFVAMHDGTLDQQDVRFIKNAAATVMLVSGGYPEAYDKGKPIRLDPKINDSIIFHAGTTRTAGEVVTNGGRVLAVTSLAKRHRKAVKRSLENINKIHFDQMYYRKDIGQDV